MANSALLSKKISTGSAMLDPQERAQSFLNAMSAYGTSPASQGFAGFQGILNQQGFNPLYQMGKPQDMLQGGNLDINGRKVFRDGQGGYRTENSMSIGTDAGEVLIPTVVDGKQLSEDEAIAHFEQTGEHLGVFATPQAADIYAEALHNRQGRRYK